MNTAPPVEAGWLLDDLIFRQAGIHHAAIVSADGLAIARSAQLSKDQVDQLSAITAGMVSLTNGAAKQFQAVPVQQTIVSMSGCHLMLMSVSNGSHLAVLAAENAELDAVAFAMCQLVERVGQAAFTPAARNVL
jgi:uncharacterized protein